MSGLGYSAGYGEQWGVLLDVADVEGAAGMAQFEARTSAESDRVVVALAGECDLAVRDELTSALLSAVGSAKIVFVDLADLRFLDSSGVHGLIAGHQAAKAQGGRLYVVNAAGVVAQVLDLTGVGDLLRPPVNGADPVRP